MLKLCTRRSSTISLTPTEFNRLAFVAQDRLAFVRRGFVEKLQKYLVKGRLSNRFYTIIFLTAFEARGRIPRTLSSPGFALARRSWAERKSQSELFGIFETKRTIANPPKAMESIFARLLSLLAQYVTPHLPPWLIWSLDTLKPTQIQSFTASEQLLMPIFTVIPTTARIL